MQSLNKTAARCGWPPWRHRRRLSTTAPLPPPPPPHRSAGAIRRQFVDYFCVDNAHQLVRSSPVVPFCDPTVAFVNAGMNQFKNVFLGTAEARAPRVANSQKCVRVGGKHNDLAVVGSDGYHHTFFEMLGNWSFGDYFKREACEHAWRLLTGVYGIDARRLYVTYFAGDARMALEADVECREIWRSLGVPDSRILPFGARDNFWEMGAVGPCGPCTEIHYDHLGLGDLNGDRAAAVNAGRDDLTEIWNLVFIQYDRRADGSIGELPQRHVDTGMGLERLVAVLQGRRSNYATDLFGPIFEQIRRASKAPAYVDSYTAADALNAAYRVLADHTRMITACLADGMMPDQNHKLRRVIRKSLSLADRSFGQPDLLHTTVPATVAILGDTYPEMQRQLPQIQQILRHEHELYAALLRDSAADVRELLASQPQLGELLDVAVEAPGFVPAFRELRALRGRFVDDAVMPGEVAFKLYDTYGLRAETIERLAEAEGLRFDGEAFAEQLGRARARTRSTFAAGDDADGDDDRWLAGLPSTENELRYNYRFNFATREYYAPKVCVQVLAVKAVDSTTTPSVDGVPPPRHWCDVVLDQSNFYPESGGQQSDRGQMLKRSAGDAAVDVEHVRTARGGLVVVHRVAVPQPDWLRPGDMVELQLDGGRRTACTLHHTATHLLNACVRRATRAVCYQRSSSVTERGLRLELGVLGRRIDAAVVEQVQLMVDSIIRTGITITIDQIDAHDFYTADDITRIPGEVYPDRNVRILSVAHRDHGGCVSREPCCGTHVINTRELEHFCVTHVRPSGRGAFALAAVAGRAALAAHELGESLRADIRRWPTASAAERERLLHRVRQLVNGSDADDDDVDGVQLPYLVRVEAQRFLDDLGRERRDASKNAMRDFVDTEIRAVLDRETAGAARAAFIVLTLPDVHGADPVPLQRAAKLCPDRAVLVCCRSALDGTVRARCTVPRSRVSAGFGAASWLREFAGHFDAGLAEPQRGQRPEEVAVMARTRVRERGEFEERLARATRGAERFATDNCETVVVATEQQQV